MPAALPTSTTRTRTRAPRPDHTSDHTGEVLDVPERVIVAATNGVFASAAPAAATDEFVAAGQVIGLLHGPSTASEIESPFDGHLMGMLATPGERLRAGDPVAWVRVS